MKHFFSRLSLTSQSIEIDLHRFDFIYEIFHSLGINMQIVGEIRHCLGSPTYPVIVTGEDIHNWLLENPIHNK